MHATTKTVAVRRPTEASRRHPRRAGRWLGPIALGAVALCAHALVALACAGPAVADWLVTADGARVETQGPWKVEGRRVLFTLPNGTLSALRLSEVDLEASERATADALKPPPEDVEKEETAKPQPVLVLTNKDVPQALPEGAEGDAAEGEGTASEATGLEGENGLRVVDWTTASLGPGEGIELTGRIENRSETLLSGIKVLVQLKDDEGEVLFTRAATVQRPSLPPNGLSNFRVPLPEMPELVGTPHFELTSTNFRARSPVPTSDEG